MSDEPYLPSDFKNHCCDEFAQSNFPDWNVLEQHWMLESQENINFCPFCGKKPTVDVK